jgi:OPT oligopeptide transporter protein
VIIVGIASQVWLRRYHRNWYKKYNYILGGALDGGAQMMIFILSFAVFGAAGVERPFPKVRFYILGSKTCWLTVHCIVGWKPREGQCRLLQW